MGLGITRLAWLARRLSRMYWSEVPYRVDGVVRATLQSRGFLSAKEVPARAADARHGAAWCQVPAQLSQASPLLAEAESLMRGELSAFGHPVPCLDGVPDWNTDPVTGTKLPSTFGLFIDFRHVGHGIDIKHLWEVNRQVWWVRFAQAYAVTRDERWLVHVRKLIGSWMEECPYAMGANWASPVEHGIRLINWSLVWHLVGGAGSALFDGAAGRALRERWLACVFQHMRFASDNYSFYSSADNHLIGEAAGVYVASRTWDLWEEGRVLGRKAKKILEQEALKQFSEDGGNREQAFCYAKFSLQFLLAAGLAGRVDGDDFNAAYWQRIESAIAFLAAMTDVKGHVPAIGDADDGEVWRLGFGEGFDPWRSLLATGARLFSRGDLQAKSLQADPRPDPQAEWLVLPDAPPADVQALAMLPSHFPEAGYSILGRSLHGEGEVRVLVDCGSLGYNRIAGHGHADALSVLLSWEGTPLLVDAGTYCYNAAPAWRHFFRGTSAHNTLVVDDTDQSLYGASFLWLRDVHSRIEEHQPGPARGVLQACHDGYRKLKDPVVHHRRVTFDADHSVLRVEDWLSCRQAHQVALLWHAAAGSSLQAAEGGWRLSAEGRSVHIAVEGGDDARVVQGQQEPPQGWVSPEFYAKEPAPVLQVRARLSPGQRLVTTLHLG